MITIAVKPWGAVDILIQTAGAGPGTVNTAIQTVGFELAVDTALDELAARYDPPPFVSPTQFDLDVTWGRTETHRTVSVGTEGMSYSARSPGKVAARLRLDAIDLVCSLYDSGHLGPLSSREVAWAENFADDFLAKVTANPRSAFEYWRAPASAIHSLLATFNLRHMSLGDLAIRTGSDKWAGLHWYTPHYEDHFAKFRNSQLRILEIGIGGDPEYNHGLTSLHMWQHYFPRALVYGLDIVDKSWVYGPRIRTIQGDQGDSAFLDQIGQQLGPFDIVIDDGSHMREHVQSSFYALYPYVRPRGYYAIEDLHASYQSFFDGEDTGSATTTPVEMLKEAIDGLHHQDIPDETKTRQFYAARDIVSLHIYHNLALVEKGRNTEPSSLPFVPKL